jgi:hypothetical protein
MKQGCLLPIVHLPILLSLRYSSRERDTQAAGVPPLLVLAAVSGLPDLTSIRILLVLSFVARSFCPRTFSLSLSLCVCVFPILNPCKDLGIDGNGCPQVRRASALGILVFGYTYLLEVLGDQTTKQPNNQTTKQPNNQTTKQPNSQAIQTRKRNQARNLCAPSALSQPGRLRRVRRVGTAMDGREWRVPQPALALRFLL